MTSHEYELVSPEQIDRGDMIGETPCRVADIWWAPSTRKWCVIIELPNGTVGSTHLGLHTKRWSTSHQRHA